MEAGLFFLLPLAILLFVRLKEFRKEMIWGGLLTSPVFLIKPLLIDLPSGLPAQAWYFLFYRVLISFAFGAIASVFYELLFRRKLRIGEHYLKNKLIYLLLGVGILIVLIVLGVPLTIALAVSLAFDLILIVTIRHDLIWDAIFSGVGMGILYVITFIITNLAFPGDLKTNLWFTGNLTGISFLSIPIEEIVVVMLIGGLVGPLYLALKGLKDSTIEMPFELHKRKLIITQFLLVLFILLGTFIVYEFFLPAAVASTSLDNANPIGLKDSITVKFNRPIKRSQIVLEISPAVPGTWSFKKSLGSHLSTEAYFSPSSNFSPSEKYIVRIGNVTNLANVGQQKQFNFTFRTQSLPVLDKFSIEDNATNIPICDPIKAYLSEEVNDLVSFSFDTIPPVKLETKLSSDKKTVEIKPEECLEQGRQYQLTSTRQINDPNIILTDSLNQITFVTKNPPKVTSFQPEGNSVFVSEKQLTLQFEDAVNIDMNKISITPHINGEWNTKDYRTYIYSVSSPLDFDTLYTVVIPKSASTDNSGYLLDDVTLKFHTIGPVVISGSTPANNTKNIAASTKITINFNQEVDHNSAELKFQISPQTKGAFSWNNNHVSFIPTSGLLEGTDYKVTILPGIKSLYGQDSVKEYEINFKTILPSHLLNIASDLQDKPLSCEVASLKMALNFKGVKVSENDLMALVGFDPTIKNGNIWGDPDKAFVGDINGKQNSTGYGVHWGPISLAANNYRQAKTFSGYSLSDLAKEINNDNPVVIWGVYRSATNDSWQTPEGKTINTWVGEHVRVITGFRGTVENPVEFILNDPYDGRITWSAEKLKANAAYFNTSGVIVY